MHKYIQNVLVTALIFIVMAVSILLPERLIQRNIKANENIVRLSNKEYTEGRIYTTLESNDDSKNLLLVNEVLAVDKKEIIPNDENTGRTKNLIMQKAEDFINILFTEGYYPFGIIEAYGDWNTREIRLYQYEEQVFHKYTVLVWEVIFESLDKKEMSRVLIDYNTECIYSIELTLNDEEPGMMQKYLPFEVLEDYVAEEILYYMYNFQWNGSDKIGLRYGWGENHIYLKQYFVSDS